MYSVKFLSPVFILLFVCCKSASYGQTDAPHYQDNTVDTFWGTTIHDPYRWMEDLQSDSIKEWLNLQDDIMRKERQKFKGKWTIARNDLLWHGSTWFPIVKKTGKWYFITDAPRRYSGPLGVLYYAADIKDEFKVAFDPNELKTGKEYSIINVNVSDNNKYAVVTLGVDNSDWRELYVRDLEENKTLSDRIQWVKFGSVVWWKDGFFYARYVQPKDRLGQNEKLSGQELYYHKIGDSQEKDALIAADPPYANSTIDFFLSSNSRYLVFDIQRREKGELLNSLVYKDLSEGLYAEMKPLVKYPVNSGLVFNLVDYADSAFLFHTNYMASNYRLIRCPIDSPNNISVVIPETKEVLQKVRRINNRFITIYFNRGKYQVFLVDSSLKILNGINFEAGIQISGFDCLVTDTQAIFYENTFYMPSAAYTYSLNSGKVKLIEETQINYRPEDYVTSLVNYKSPDGTEIPMYLICKKGLKIKGDNPVILLAEGSGGAAVPFYRYSHITFLDNGGIIAMPMARGCDNLGSNWEHSGEGPDTQNAIDDITAAANYLVSAGYTTYKHLAAMSYGGALLGSIIVQHPDLFGVVVYRSNTFDLLHFDEYTGGKYWQYKYGVPQDSTNYKKLLEYSPLYNLNNSVSYPASLFITSGHDDRVPPFHTFKFLASLQSNPSSSKPYILYYNPDAGHEIYESTIDRYDEDSFITAFIFTEMNIYLSGF